MGDTICSSREISLNLLAYRLHYVLASNSTLLRGMAVFKHALPVNSSTQLLGVEGRPKTRAEVSDSWRHLFRTCQSRAALEACDDEQISLHLRHVLVRSSLALLSDLLIQLFSSAKRDTCQACVPRRTVAVSTIHPRILFEFDQSHVHVTNASALKVHMQRDAREPLPRIHCIVLLQKSWSSVPRLDCFICRGTPGALRKAYRYACPRGTW